jgi:adenylate cyclase
VKPAVAVALAAVLLAPLAALTRSDSGSGTIEVLERWSVDWRFRARGPRVPSSNVALVVFDDQTAERAGPLFERRAGWAKVITAIAASGAKVIGVDAVFDVPERLLGPALQARVEGRPPAEGNAVREALLEDIAKELDGDATLARAIEQAGNVVLILYAGTQTGKSSDPSQLSRARYAQAAVGPTPPSTVETVLASQPAITHAAKAMGFANVTEDETRTVRRLPMVQGFHDAFYQPFTVPLAAAALDVPRARVAWLGVEQEVRVGEQVVALDRDSLWLDYAGPAKTFPTYSALDLMEGRVPRAALEGKLVLLGVTRLGYDAARTPFGSMPGVEVQATAVDDVLTGLSLRRTSRVNDVLATAGLGLLVALLFISRRVGPVAQVLGALALLGVWLVVTYQLFAQGSRWAPWVVPALAVFTCLGVGLVFSYLSESRQRRALRNAFNRYVGQDVLDELLANPGSLSLGGEKRTLSILFSDIRDFTTVSERLSPTELITFLNTYLTPMTRAVLAEGGLLDKYIGDAVMGVFGAPIPREDHASQALRCVLAMHRELEVLNAGALKALGLEVAIGVGVNSGDVVAGNMGAEERFDYTVVGDAVNLASRLEGVSKVYGVFCLVGEATVKAAGPGFSFRELDQVQVKGKHQAVAVYELLSGLGRVVVERAELAAWNTGLAAFRAGRLPEARVAFATFQRANPKDLAVARYVERLAELPEHAPERFSAVTAFKTK